MTPGCSLTIPLRKGIVGDCVGPWHSEVPGTKDNNSSKSTHTQKVLNKLKVQGTNDLHKIEKASTQKCLLLIYYLPQDRTGQSSNEQFRSVELPQRCAVFVILFSDCDIVF